MTYLKNHRSLLIIIGVIPTVLVFLFLGSLYLMPKTLASPPKNVPKNIEPIIYLDNLKVKDMLEEYQECLIENDMFPYDIAYLTEQDGSYYIGVFQDILLFINPVNYNNIEEDFVYQVGIMITSDSTNYELAKEYYKLLLKVNNKFILNADDFTLEVINNNGESLDKNNGLLGAYLTLDDEINFVIERKIKQ